MYNENEKTTYWVELADYDLATAFAMLETRRFLYVGFMCHQVVEKLLKAYHVHRLDETPPHIHNLARLAVLSGLYEQFNLEQRDFLDTLEPLNVEARYPTNKQSIQASLNFEKCKALIEKTKEFTAWIKNQF